MGGYGSGRWNWHTKKQTVEHCLTLDIRRFVGHIVPITMFERRRSWQGSIVWTNTATGKQTASMSYKLAWPDDTPLVALDYVSTFPDGSKQASAYAVELTATPCHYGGERYWFLCPRCNRRVGCLQLPPMATKFGCRHCYNLTYRSAQKAHEFDRGAFAGLFQDIDRVVKADAAINKLRSGQRLNKRDKKALAELMNKSPQARR